jgi:hypothetical protein
VRQFLSNEGMPNPELPPLERFTKFAGIIAKVSKAEADKEDVKDSGAVKRSVRSRVSVRRAKNG